MLNPAYKLSFTAPNGGGFLTSEASTAFGGGSKVIDTSDDPQTSIVTDLTVCLDMNVPADYFALVLGQVGTFRPEHGGGLTIELGYADEDALVQVMTGTIVTLKPDLTKLRISGASDAMKLLRSFTNKTYESKTAGQIVNDLAGQADVSVAEPEDGITFPAYVIDGRQSIFHHMHKLASLCGFDLYFNADNELVFKVFTQGNTVHILEYAKHILELESQRTMPRAGTVEAWGESPGGSQAEEAWAWLTKDFSGTKGLAGSDESTLLLEQPALRTAEAAQAAADATIKVIRRRTLRGHLLTPGKPDIKLGDAIRLRGMPDDSLNDTFQVLAVTHSITKHRGFTTRIRFQSI